MDEISILISMASVVEFLDSRELKIIKQIIILILFDISNANSIIKNQACHNTTIPYLGLTSTWLIVYIAIRIDSKIKAVC